MSEPVKTRTVFVWSLFGLLSIFIIQLLCVLWVNQGHLIYSLDDAYIHLSVSRAIAHGGYGVNVGEISAPASSILWPLLLAPFAGTALHVYVPLVLNIICMAWSVYILSGIVCRCLGEIGVKLCVFFSLLLSFCCSVLWLVWLGMEHSLQLLVVAYIAQALLKICDEQEPGLPLYISLIIAPMVRYELLALSLGAMIFVFLAGYRKQAIISLLITCGNLGLFSLFLHANGFWLLPSSIVLKLPALAMARIEHSLSFYQNPFLVPFMICFFSLSLVLVFEGKLRSKSSRLVQLAILLMVAHMLFGAFARVERYSVYLYGFVLPTLLYSLRQLITRGIKKQSNLIAILVPLLLAMYFFFPYLRVNFIFPIQASQGIYLQQYQMQRLFNLYKKPIAVNDIGMVTFYGHDYVLDLAGLSLPSPLLPIRVQLQENWMDVLCRARNAHLVLIYDSWFNLGIPNRWKKLGEFHVDVKNVVLGDTTVSFYATPGANLALIKRTIQQWQKGLPKRAQYHTI